MDSPTAAEDELFVPLPLTPESNSNNDAVSNDSGQQQQQTQKQRHDCGCPRYRPHLPDTQSVVASVSLPHTVVQDPNRVLESLPRHRKAAEERLFLLDVWLRRPALYYTWEVINAFIDAFKPLRLEAGQQLIRERDSISCCHVVYKGQLRLLKDHPAPCALKYQVGGLESGAELFYDPLYFKQPSQCSCVAVEETLLFSLGLRDLVNLTAAVNEIRRGAFLDCLRAIKYLKPLTAKELHALAESWDEPLKTFDYEAGYPLQEQGAVPSHLYYILHGSVELADGRISVRRGAGQIVCAQALLQLPSPYMATVAELSTLVGLEVQLCANSLRERLTGDTEGLARLTEELRMEMAQEELDAAQDAAAAAAAATAAAVADADATDAAASAAMVAAEVQQQLNLQSLHRRSVLRLCRTPQLRGLLRPTELDGLLSDRVQKTTHIRARQRNDCLYAAGTDYAKYVYVVLEGELRETAPDGPDGFHALLRVVRKGECACLESLLLLSACLCPRSAYANTACTVVSLDVDAMEEALCRTFIDVMKRRPETFRQCVGAQFASSADAVGRELAFRDEVFPRDVDASDFNLGGHEELAFKALAVLRLVVQQLQLLMEPLGQGLTAHELRSLRHCHRAVILGGGRSGGRYSAGETVVTEEESRRRILYFVRSGEASVVHLRGSRPAPEGGERPETRSAGSLLCSEQLYLPTICCYEARATRDNTKVALVNQHVLETAMGCYFRSVFLRQPDAFREFLADRYPGLAEAEMQQLLAASEPAEPESQDRRTGRVYAFGLEALLCHHQLGRLFTDKELQRLRAAPPSVMPFIAEKRPNQSIYLEGTDQISNLFVVYTGRVTSTVTPGPNRPKQLLETHEPGDLLGSESFFRTGIRSTSAYAAGATELIVVSVEKLESVLGSAIEEVLARDPGTGRAIFRRVFPPGIPLPRDGWRPGVDLQLLLAEDEGQQGQHQHPEGSRRLRGRHLRAEAQILREAECSRNSSLFLEDRMSPSS